MMAFAPLFLQIEACLSFVRNNNTRKRLAPGCADNRNVRRREKNARSGDSNVTAFCNHACRVDSGSAFGFEFPQGLPRIAGASRDDIRQAFFGFIEQNQTVCNQLQSSLLSPSFQFTQAGNQQDYRQHYKNRACRVSALRCRGAKALRCRPREEIAKRQADDHAAA